MESPKGSHEHVSHSSPVEHDDVHEVSIDLLQVQVDNFVERNDVQSDSHSSPHVDRNIDLSLLSFEDAEGSLMMGLEMSRKRLSCRMVQRRMLCQRFTVILGFRKTWSYGAELRSMIKNVLNHLSSLF